MAVDVDRDRADGAVFHLVVEPVFGQQLLELAPALRHFEPAVADLLQPMLAGILIGALAREEDMRALLHEYAREADRRPRRAQSGNRAGRTVAAVHNRRVELDAALGGQHAAAAGVEAGILLQLANRRLDGVDGALAFLENRRARLERAFEAGARAFLLLGREPARAHRPGAAVNHQPPTCHAAAHSRACASIPVDADRSAILL